MFPRGVDALRVARRTVEILTLGGAQGQQHRAVDAFHIHALEQDIYIKRRTVEKAAGKFRKILISNV